MLERDDALRICDTVLAHAKAAGAEDATVTIQSSVEAHARFADNRINTSGRSEDLDITVTVWVGRRRGTITGNDAGSDALKRMADDAVQVARVSPVHREYVPTLGPLDYPDARGFASATADVNVTARATSLEAVLAACRNAKVTGAGFHSARASAVAAATANGNRRYFRSSEAGLSVTARSADGTGSGYCAGDHFDLARLDVTRIAEQAVQKAIRSREPKPIEPAAYPVILEPQAVSDLMGFLINSFDARTADEGRSAFAAKDGKTRLGEKLFNERINLYSDPMHPEMPAVPSTPEGVPATRLSLVRSGVLENLEVLTVLGAGAQARANAWTGELHSRELAAGDLDRRDDQRHGPWPADLPVLVRPSRRSTHDRPDRPDARRPLVDREGRHQPSGAQLALQSERAGDAGAVERRGDRHPTAPGPDDGARPQAQRLHVYVGV